MIAQSKQASAQTPPDSLYGACPEGVYFREDVIDLVSKELAKSIMIGGSVTNWVLKEALLYGDPFNSNAPGYYVLRFKKLLKVGRTITIYVKVDESTWLPDAASDFDIFKDEDVVRNDQDTGWNLRFKVTNYIRFNFSE